MLAAWAFMLNYKFWILPLFSWFGLFFFLLFRQWTSGSGVQRSNGGSMKWLECAVLGAIHVYTFVDLKDDVTENSHYIAYMAVCTCFLAILSSKSSPFLLSDSWSVQVVGVFDWGRNWIASQPNILHCYLILVLSVTCIFRMVGGICEPG
jgi:hypothetical protein